MCMCMSMCTQTCVSMCIYVCMLYSKVHTHMYTQAHVYIHVCRKLRALRSADGQIYAYLCMCVYLWVYINTSTYVCKYLLVASCAHCIQQMFKLPSTFAVQIIWPIVQRPLLFCACAWYKSCHLTKASVCVCVCVCVCRTYFLCFILCVCWCRTYFKCAHVCLTHIFGIVRMSPGQTCSHATVCVLHNWLYDPQCVYTNQRQIWYRHTWMCSKISFIYMYVCIYVCMYMYVYMYMCIYVHIYIYTYIFIHKYIIHTHT